MTELTKVEQYQMLGLMSDEIEQGILHVLLHSPDDADEIVRILEPEDFCDPRHRALFQALAQLLDNLEAPTMDRVLHYVDRGPGVGIIDEVFLRNLSSFGLSPERMAYTLKKLTWLRHMADFATWLAERLQDSPDPEELFAEAQAMLAGISPTNGKAAFVYGWQTDGLHMQIIQSAMEAAKTNEPWRFDWPWSSWNAIVRPLLPGMVGTLAAPDGMGKSLYLEQIAEHWAANGNQVVLVHLEDNLSYKLNRRMARYAKVPIDAIEDGVLSEIQQREIEEARRRMAPWVGNLHYYHAPGKSMAEIIRELSARVDEGVCQAVVFDYLDKCRPDARQAKLFGTNTWERQADDMEQLKTFAERFHIPVMVATQGNKAMQQQATITRMTIQGSGQKSQKSQLVILLARELVGEAGLRTPDGRLIAQNGEYSPVVQVRVDKQNRGRTGGFKQFLVGKFFLVTDIQD